jgi:hypothetical protein
MRKIKALIDLLLQIIEITCVIIVSYHYFSTAGFYFTAYLYLTVKSNALLSNAGQDMSAFMYICFGALMLLAAIPTTLISILKK